MSQSNTLLPCQGTLAKGDPAAISSHDRSDQKSPTTKMPSQQMEKDVTQSDNRNITAESVSTDNKNTVEGVGEVSIYAGIQGVGGASTYEGIKQNSYPCEPCERRQLKCDGVRPMCGNCEFTGRRCVYD